MGDDLGIRVGCEGIAFGFEFRTQRLEVLDDAVVHQADAPIGKVRMGVPVAGHAVGRPAGVGDADTSFDGLAMQLGGEFAHLAGPLAQGHVRLAGRHDGDARGVVAPVFEALQPLEQDGRYVAVGDGADDAAHQFTPCPCAVRGVSSP